MVAFAIIGTLSAQEKVKQKELGLVFENLNSFGITYKFGHHKSMWRLKSLYGSGHQSDYKATDEERVGKQYTLSFSFGKQFAKEITDKVDLIYGLDIKYSYLYNYSKDVSNYNEYANREYMEYYHAPGLNLLIGFNYIINESIIIGAELLPGCSYAFGKKTESYSNDPDRDVEFDTSQFGFNLSSSSVSVSLAYRFH